MTLRKQLPATPALVIRRSSVQGRGGFATRRIRKGERIGEYVGEIVTQGEADRRYDDDAMARHHTFLFAVTQRTVIDAGFLELVRLGLKSAGDPAVIASLPVVDATIKSTTSTGVGWHRYNGDGYGDGAADGHP